jgi:hypothetical protein
LNAVELDSFSYTQSGGSVNSFTSAFTNGNTYGFLDGFIDEVRVSYTDRSIGWISTCFNNQYAPDSFYEVGEEDAVQSPLNNAPLVSDIPDQTIEEGESFTAISLDDFVMDVDDPDSAISWSYGGSFELIVDITDRVATIIIPDEDWNGEEVITFNATDPLGAGDEDSATFTVLKLHQLSIKSEWNLISLPFNESVNKLDIIVRNNSIDYSWNDAVNEGIIVGLLYDWDRTQQQYKLPFLVNILEPGRGYWTYAYYDCELLISSNAVSSNHITDLKQNWSLMGIPFNTTLHKENLTIRCNNTDYTWDQAVTNNIIIQYIYAWDRVDKFYIVTDYLDPTYGYWMFAYHDCTLKKQVLP